MLTRLSRDLGLSLKSVRHTAELLEEGATVPFIARYRKERTGGLTDEQIIALRDGAARWEEIEKRRDYILSVIEEQGKLSEHLKEKIGDCDSLGELEDLYLPYKPRRKTRADAARELGLEGLKKELYNRDNPRWRDKAVDYARRAGITPEEACRGAMDILAQEICENPTTRQKGREFFERQARAHSKVKNPEKDPEGKFRDYYDWSEPINRAAHHRLSALFRGEREGVLSLAIRPEKEQALERLGYYYVNKAKNNAEAVKKALADGYKRLLEPALEKELRHRLKEECDATSISVFADNLRQVLMASPLGEKVILALDPGFRTGCKLVVLDRDGSLLHHGVIYPTAPHNRVEESARIVKDLMDRFAPEAVAVGNGTAGRETEVFLKSLDFLKSLPVVSVNESGASVYSASEEARREFPDKDVTVRGAVSIGRRLLDPLSELIKIDPQSIGVGQYQHDVDQKSLSRSLDDVVEECVNRVGVNLNTAGTALLAHVSGLNRKLAGAIVKERQSRGGRFALRKELLEVKGMGRRSFELSAGFLRITDGDLPLDGSGVHPESYDVVEKMAASLGVPVVDLMGEEKLISRLNPEDFTDAERGLPTVTDIINELKKPGRDPRETFEQVQFDDSIRELEDLEEGMMLPGVVTNVTGFGAFVDLGVHQDGLIHISEMADRYVADPSEVVRVNQQVTVKVIQVDRERRRIGLSMKGIS